MRFVMETITAHPVFEFVHIEPTKFWESLLFLDEHNYGGMEVHLPTTNKKKTTN